MQPLHKERQPFPVGPTRAVRPGTDIGECDAAFVVPVQRPAPLEPFIKWAGGKRHLAGRLISLLPSQLGRYYEPFLGSGAVFFALRPEHAVLADSNQDLIQCFQQVRDNVDDLIQALRELPNSQEAYYRIRASIPTEPAARAARTLYLVQLAFNGIYRVNSKTGLFNVPYGQHLGRVVLREDRLRLASQALQRARIVCDDFETATQDATESDVVYLDPPYTVAHNSNGFVRYNQRLFSWEDQLRLASSAEDLVTRGCFVIVSNAYHHSIRELYPSFKRTRIRRPSQMAADIARRRSVYEYVLVGHYCDA